MYQDILNMVLEMVGNDYLYFSDALEIKKTPHEPPCNIWAVCVSHNQEIYLMDSDEQWNKLEVTDLNYVLVLGTLYQRIKLLSRQVTITT